MQRGSFCKGVEKLMGSGESKRCLLTPGDLGDRACSLFFSLPHILSSAASAGVLMASSDCQPRASLKTS